MKCFMGLGWLIGFEVCRPSLYMWWGNIQFFITQYTGHFMSLLLYIKYQRFKCPTASINHIFILFYSITAKCPAHLESEPKRSRQTSPDEECHASPLFSALKFDFSNSRSLWLTGDWAIWLHQKVQPDSLIWQPSSNQIHSLFLALHHLDKKESRRQKEKNISIPRNGFHNEMIKPKLIVINYTVI